jgi:type-F conjugative transfer system pilin assembly protein TrbC
MGFGIRLIVLLIFSFITFFPFLEYRIPNPNLIPDLQAQEVNYPQLTQGASLEELKRADEMLRGFQKPREREARELIKEFQKTDINYEALGVKRKPNSESQNPIIPTNGKLFYFFSFSMPRESLGTVLPEAEKTGAIMVLRGMKKDIGLRKTMLMIADLLKRGEKESYQAEVWIHPVLFKCFNVDSVPQIVYVTGTQDEEGCSNDYVKVRGDVSLEYALRLFAKEDRSAEKYLKLLEDNFYEKD